MKKNIKLIFAIIIMATLATSCKDNKQIAPDNFKDETIISFVTTHFPDALIASVSEEATAFVINLKEYDIVLNDGTVLDFDRKSQWEEVDCRYSSIYKTVPATIVPEQITSYVANTYPGTTIVEISKDGTRWEVELSGGQELDFNKNFQFIQTTSNTSGYDQTIQGFVSTYFPQSNIVQIREDYDSPGIIEEYEVRLNDGTKLEFNAQYDWLSVDCSHSNVYTAIPTELIPTAVVTLVTDHFTQQSVVSIDKDEDDNETEVLLNDGTEITFNVAFEWTEVDCEYSGVYNAVPAYFVPQQIADYITTNFAGKLIVSISKDNQNWEVQLNNDLELVFDSNFNFVGIDD